MKNQKKNKIGILLNRLLLPIVVAVIITLWLKRSFIPIEILQKPEDIEMVQISQGINVKFPKWHILLGEDIKEFTDLAGQHSYRLRKCYKEQKISNIEEQALSIIVVYEDRAEQMFIYPSGDVDFLDRTDLIQTGYFGIFKPDNRFYNELQERYLIK